LRNTIVEEDAMSIHRQLDVFALFLIVLLGLSVFRLLERDEAPPDPVPSTGDVRSYNAGVADHFGVRLAEVEASAERVTAHELPVVFLLARYGSAEVPEVLDLRGQGLGWQQIAARIGLGAEIFYYPLGVPPDRIYASAYRQFLELPRSQWSSVELEDSEIVALVNLRFLAEQTGERPARVAELRARGHDFIGIHDHLQRQSLHAERQEAASDPEPG
jgi:hypothetical protein